MERIFIKADDGTGWCCLKDFGWKIFRSRIQDVQRIINTEPESGLIVNMQCMNIPEREIIPAGPKLKGISGSQDDIFRGKNNNVPVIILNQTNYFKSS